MSTILIVDDEPGLRQLYQTALSRQGYKVVVASNGNEGLMAMEMAQPDLVLLDVAMPEMDGVQFLEILRKTPEWSKIPVIVLTGFATREQWLSLDSIGMTSHLTKAEFSLRELRARIAEELAIPAPAAA